MSLQRCYQPSTYFSLPEAKALRFFTACDLDGSGEIDMTEFNGSAAIAQALSKDPKNMVNTTEYTVLSPKAFRFYYQSATY